MCLYKWLIILQLIETRCDIFCVVLPADYKVQHVSHRLQFVIALLSSESCKPHYVNQLEWKSLKKVMLTLNIAQAGVWSMACSNQETVSDKTQFPQESYLALNHYRRYWAPSPSVRTIFYMNDLAMIQVIFTIWPKVCSTYVQHEKAKARSIDTFPSLVWKNVTGLHRPPTLTPSNILEISLNWQPGSKGIPSRLEAVEQINASCFSKRHITYWFI